MTEPAPLTSAQLQRLAQTFHAGAAEASCALQRWLDAPALFSMDSVEQRSLEEGSAVLRECGETIGMCLMHMQGSLAGQMILAFDDASGLMLADLLLQQPPGTASQWGEVEVSAAQESMNILGSAYLNGMAASLSRWADDRVDLLPTPPLFFRDFAESLLQTAFLEQASVGSQLFFAEARFELQGRPLNWTFLLIPDPESLTKLGAILSSSDACGESRHA